MRVLGVLVFALAMSLASPSSLAWAGTLSIDFDLGGSSFNARAINGLPLFTVRNGMNGSVTGSTRVVLSGVDALGVPSEPQALATLSSFSLLFNVSVLNLGPVGGPAVDILGTLEFSQVGDSTAAFTGGNIFSTPTLRFNQAVNCVGSTSQCAAITSATGITFPAIFDSTSPTSLSFALAQLGTPGAASLTGAVNNAVLSGREISRSFVPEPDRAGLLAAGLALLALVRLARRGAAG